MDRPSHGGYPDAEPARQRRHFIFVGQYNPTQIKWRLDEGWHVLVIGQDAGRLQDLRWAFQCNSNFAAIETSTASVQEVLETLGIRQEDCDGLE